MIRHLLGEPADGLGPLKQPGNEEIVRRCYYGLGVNSVSEKPCQLPSGHAGAHWFGIGPAPVAAIPLTPEKEQRAKKLIHDLAERTLAKPVVLPTPVDLRAPAERTLIFLCDLVPMPGWSKETERELLACVRGLKEALRESRQPVDLCFGLAGAPRLRLGRLGA